MSKECITQCPRILAAEKEVRSNWSAASGLFIDGDTDQLMSACEVSYDCPGPATQPVEVVKGFFKKRVEIEQQTVCGLQQESQA
jgi:hypothetical protein